VKELTESDGRVKLFGTVVAVDTESGKISIDDSTGVVEIFFNSLDIIEKLKQYKVGDQIVVVGWVAEGGIDGEILRRVRGFEPSRYKNVLEVWKDVRSKIEQSDDSGRADESGL